MNDDEKRRRYIIEKIESGTKQAEIARELGLSRQAVSAAYKRYKTRGDSFLDSPGRGRRKESDTLTSEEKERAIAWLMDHEPSDLGLDDASWDLYSVKRAVVHLHQKRINLERAHELFTRAGLKVVPKDLDPVYDDGLPSLEDMERINQETIKKMSASASHVGPSSRRRTSKHAKGRPSPTQKKKKRKKR